MRRKRPDRCAAARSVYWLLVEPTESLRSGGHSHVKDLIRSARAENRRAGYRPINLPLRNSLLRPGGELKRGAVIRRARCIRAPPPARDLAGGIYLQWLPNEKPLGTGCASGPQRYSRRWSLRIRFQRDLSATAICCASGPGRLCPYLLAAGALAMQLTRLQMQATPTPRRSGFPPAP